jgi:hypothetical protein
MKVNNPLLNQAITIIAKIVIAVCKKMIKGLVLASFSK